MKSYSVKVRWLRNTSDELPLLTFHREAGQKSRVGSAPDLPSQSIIQSHLKLFHRYVFTSSFPPSSPPISLLITLLCPCVSLPQSEWSSCNCLSLGESESGTKEPYRNHICIQDELRCCVYACVCVWGVGGGRTVLLPYTEQHHLCVLPSFSHPLSSSSHLIWRHPHLLHCPAWLPLHCLSGEFQGRRELCSSVQASVCLVPVWMS